MTNTPIWTKNATRRWRCGGKLSDVVASAQQRIPAAAGEGVMAKRPKRTYAGRVMAKRPKPLSHEHDLTTTPYGRKFLELAKLIFRQ